MVCVKKLFYPFRYLFHREPRVFRARIALCGILCVVGMMLLDTQPLQNDYCRANKLSEFSYSYLDSLSDHIIRFFNHELRFSEFSPFRYPRHIDLNKIVSEYDNETAVTSEFPPPLYEHAKNVIVPHTRATCDAPELLILVNSIPDHITPRLAIRQTWGNDVINRNIKTYFLLGKDMYNNDKIKEESFIYNDIVQGDFVDGDLNKTIKLVYGLQWADRWCPEAKYTLIIDDDYIAFPDRIISYLSRQFTTNKNVYMGFMNVNLSPHRSYFYNRRVTYDQYPYHVFPKYVSIGSVILSRDVVHDLAIATLYVKRLVDADAYIGIVMYKLGYSPFPSDLMTVHKSVPSHDIFEDILTSRGYLCHHDVIDTWNFYNLMTAVL